MSVAPRIPGKLNPQFDCQALYNFDGDWTDTSGQSPAADLASYGSGTDFTFSQDHTGAKCLMARSPDRGLQSAIGITRLQITGDVTVQVVCKFSEFGFDTSGCNLVQFEGIQGGGNPPAEGRLWAVQLDDDTDRMVPRMVWEPSGAGSQITKDDTFTLDTGRWYHLVGVREGSAARVYVNNLLIVSASGLLPTTGGTNSRVRIGESSTGILGLLNGTQISSVKVSDRVLTAGEIAQEFTRVRGAV